MADTKIIVTSSDSNNSITQKTIPNINPDASSTALKTFGQKLTALTDNTYVKTDRIDKTNCDTAVEKLTPNVALDPSADALTRSACLAGANPLINITTDGEVMIVNNDNTTWCTTLRLGSDTGRYRLYVGIVNSATEANATAPHDIVIRTTETDTYKAGEFTITINPDS